MERKRSLAGPVFGISPLKLFVLLLLLLLLLLVSVARVRGLRRHWLLLLLLLLQLLTVLLGWACPGSLHLVSLGSTCSQCGVLGAVCAERLRTRRDTRGRACCRVARF